MTGNTGLGQAPAGGGGQRAALGEQWRINSCFCGQFRLRRKQGRSGYVSLVYFSPNYTLNPDGVNKSVGRGQSVYPLRMEGGESCPNKHSGLLLCTGILLALFNCFFLGGGYKKRINSNISRSNWNPWKETVIKNNILICIFICKRNEINLRVCIWEVLGSWREGAWQKDEARGLGLILLRG